MSGVIEVRLTAAELFRSIDSVLWYKGCPWETKINAAMFSFLSVAGVPVKLKEPSNFSFDVTDGVLESYEDRIDKHILFRWTPGVTSAAEPNS